MLGMDTDVWKSKLSIFLSTLNVNIDIHIHIIFNMIFKWIYLNLDVNILLYPIKDVCSTQIEKFGTIRIYKE